MLKKILIVLTVLVLLLVGVLAALPSDYAVRTELEIESDPTETLAKVSDLASWPEWSFWSAKNDLIEQISFEFSTPSSGLGAWMSWKSPRGNGKLTITEVVPNRGVKYEMNFEGQPASSGQVGVILSDKGHVTISYAEQGKVPFFARILRPALEAEMGREFDRALSRLESKVTRSEGE